MITFINILNHESFVMNFGLFCTIIDFGLLNENCRTLVLTFIINYGKEIMCYMFKVSFIIETNLNL